MKLDEVTELSSISSIGAKNGVEIHGINGYVPSNSGLNFKLESESAKLPKLPEKLSYFELTDNLFVSSLEGAPKHVSNHVLIRGNSNLKSLKGGPISSGGFYYAHENDLHDLIGAPTHVGGDFTCHQNRNLSSIEGGPHYVKGNVKLNMNNSLKSLEGIGTKWFVNVRGKLFAGNRVTSNALGLVLMNCDHFALLFPGSEIIMEYVSKKTPSQRMDAMHDCQAKLIDAGFDELAKL